MTRGRGAVRWLVAGAIVVMAGWMAPRAALAQEAAPSVENAAAAAPPTPADLAQQTLPLRTALHHDPTLAAPLERLIEAYRKADRLADLLGMYRQHVAQYPQDVGGAVVLARLLHETGDEGAAAFLERASQQHPEAAFLHYLRALHLRQRDPAAGLEALHTAIQREPDPARKRAWIDELLPLAQQLGRTDLIATHLEALASDPLLSPQGLLDVAQRMLGEKLYELAAATLARAAEASPPPTLQIELDLAMAEAEDGQGKTAEAAARLDAVLGALVADHWRRPEVLRRRLALARTPAQREALLTAARERVAARPADEALVVDLAQWLIAADQRSEAMRVLREAAARHANSEVIEKMTLALYERMADAAGKATYLASRLEAQPRRDDLRLELVRTQFLLGRADDAEAALAPLLAGAGDVEAGRLLVELGRYLRRASLGHEAAGMLERALARQPGRLDLRRELAEVFIGLGQPDRAGELLTDLPAGDASSEHVLELAQFMLHRQFPRQAMPMVDAAIARHPVDLELRLMRVALQGRLGELAEGQRTLAAARELADTAARYRQWLAAAVAFDEVAGEGARRLHVEAAALAQEDEQAGGAWSEARAARRLALVETYAAGEHRRAVIELVERWLEMDPPEQFALALRQKLVPLLLGDPELAPRARAHLEVLARAQPGSAGGAALRLALLTAEQGDAAAQQVLLEADIAAIDDLELLGQLEAWYAWQGRQELYLAALERRLDLDPSDRGSWSRWLSVLVQQGREDKFRMAVRRLLAGVQGVVLEAAAQALLREHLLDSCWRTIARQIADAEAASAGGGDAQEAARAYGEVLQLLDMVEAAATSQQVWLWATWTRAHVLGALGRTAERDEAIADLARVAGQADGEDAGEVDGSDPVMIAFPDGMAMSLGEAVRTLQRGSAAQGDGGAEPLPDRRGPLPPLNLRWLARPGTAQLVDLEVLPAAPAGDAGRTVAMIVTLDTEGVVAAFDVVTGKVRWRQRIEGASTMHGGQYHVMVSLHGGGRHYVQLQPQPAALLPLPAGAGEAGVLVTRASGAVALSAADGAVRWEAAVEPGAGMSLMVSGRSGGGAVYRPPVQAALGGGSVLLWDGATGVIRRIDAGSGKLLARRVLVSAGDDEQAAAGVRSQGMSVSGDAVLVFGRGAAILDARTLEPLWSFDASAVRALPVDLADAATAVVTGPGGTAVVSTPFLSAMSMRTIVGRHIMPAPHWHSGLRPMAAPTGRWRPVSGAVAWAAAEGSTYRDGAIMGPWLILESQGALQMLRRDLPLAAMPAGGAGTLLGRVGPWFVFHGGGQLHMARADGTWRQAGWEDGGAGPVLPDGVIDGPLVWVSHSQGVRALQIGTGEVVLRSDWPAAVKSRIEATEAQMGGAPKGATQFRLGGRMMYIDNGYSSPIPPLMRAYDGLLIASPLPGLVVALEQADEQ